MATAEQRGQYGPIEMQTPAEQQPSGIEDEELEDDFDRDFWVEVQTIFYHI